MGFENGADVYLDGIPLRVDPDAPLEIQQPSFQHQDRQLFVPGTNITGRPGARNIREDRLPWHITNWDGGEGQTTLNNEDDASARKFFSSEGVDMQVPGQLSLNYNIARNTPQDTSGGATDTKQGSAYSDVTGTSTVVNTTDRRLNAEADVIESTNHTPGAGQVSVAFNLYKEPPQLTTIEGDDGFLEAGGGQAVGDDFSIQQAATWRTGNVSSLEAQPYLVQFTLSFPDAPDVSSPQADNTATITVKNQDSGDIVAIDHVVLTDTSVHTFSLTFTPNPTKSYRFRVHNTGSSRCLIDQVDYGLASQPTDVTLTVRNHTATTTILTQTVTITAETSSPTTLLYTAAAATNYRYRVQFDDGVQRPILDSTVTTVATTGAYSFDAMHIGQGGKVRAVGTLTSSDPTAFSYNFTSESWQQRGTALADATAGALCLGLASTDAYEYALFDDGIVIQFDDSTDNDYITPITDATGIAVCQDRLGVLAETSTGVDLNLYAVDADVSAAVTPIVSTVDVSSAIVDADTTLRQRMVGTPSGFVFFVNYSFETVIYRVDTSAASPVATELGRLDPGARASAISHVLGLTFIGGQFMAEEDEDPIPALWMLDSSGAPPRRVGFFRRFGQHGPERPQFMQPYQNDLYVLQAPYIWRWNLASGGLFLEYELAAGDDNAQRALAVLGHHVFAMFYRESSTQASGTVWVSAVDGGYRTTPGVVTSSVNDWGVPGEEKLLRRVQVSTDDMPADTSVLVEVQADQAGTWVPIGTHDSGSESLYQGGDLTFRNLQVRTTLASTTGTNTPTVKAVIPEALALGFDEFFTLTVLTEDEDSMDHVGGQHRTGGEIALALWELRRTGLPVTLIDGYTTKETGVNQEYLVRVEGIRHSNDLKNEGRLQLTLRVL